MTDAELDAEARRLSGELGRAARKNLHAMARECGVRELPGFDLYIDGRLYRIPAQKVDIE